MSLTSSCSGGSAPDFFAKIFGSAPDLNSVQRNQIYLYPKIVSDYRALVNALILKKKVFSFKNCIKQHFSVTNDAD